MSLTELRRKLAEALGIDAATREVLEVGSAHDYACRCETCRLWWREVGPDETDGYGPFIMDEIHGSKTEE